MSLKINKLKNTQLHWRRQKKLKREKTKKEQDQKD